MNTWAFRSPLLNHSGSSKSLDRSGINDFPLQPPHLPSTTIMQHAQGRQCGSPFHRGGYRVPWTQTELSQITTSGTETVSTPTLPRGCNGGMRDSTGLEHPFPSAGSHLRGADPGADAAAPGGSGRLTPRRKQLSPEVPPVLGGCPGSVVLLRA